MNSRGNGGARTRARNLLALLRGQFWSIPALFAAAAGGLAYVLLVYGAPLAPAGAEDSWWLYSGEAETARELISSLLSGMMTMTSLVVSVTFVILTLAANQLGPRLIEIFIGDRQIQSVLGLFIGTILYLILILRTLDDTLGENGVPHLAVTGGSVLTVACLLALLFYIHKIARSIIADNVVDVVASELRATLDSVMSGDGETEDEALTLPEAGTVAVGRAGYVQVVDYDALVRTAHEGNLQFDVRVRAGHHVLKEGRHVVVHGLAPLGAERLEAVRGAFTVGALRTPAQDPEHGIRQLVEIATRALSPGINDPFTAKAVIDRLASTFEEVFAHGLQPRLLRDDEGVLRVRADRADIDGLLDAAFHPVRQAGSDHPAILIHMADAIGALAPAVRSPRERAALRRQLDHLEGSAELGRMTGDDRRETMARIGTARRLLARDGD